MTEFGPSPSPEPRIKPPGVLPRNLQAWVIGGLAVVMMLIILFSGGTAPKEVTPVAIPGTDVSDPNAARIQEYRARIEEQLKRLSQEQARLAQTQGRLSANTSPAGAILSGGPPHGGSGETTAGYASASRPERSWIFLDREKRQYEARYASSIALTRRDAASGSAGSRLNAPSPEALTGQAIHTPVAPDPANRILEGTVIETALVNRLDGTFSGPVNCIVTTPVYSEDRRRVLIPRGSRVLGQVTPVESFGQQRLAVSFHRLILPDKTSVALDSPPGLSQVGETGLRDQVNRHYGQIFGVSLAIGAIAGLSQVNTTSGANASSAELYRQGVASSLSQTSLNILDRFLNVLPTFTIREGHRIKVYLTGDLYVPRGTREPSLAAPPVPEGGLK